MAPVERPGGPPRRRGARHAAVPSANRWLGILVALYGVSRLAFYLAGVRFDASALHPTAATDQWQLLDTRLLAHHALQSIWYLHSQPPLYNLFCAVVLHLPRAAQAPVAAATFLLLGLGMVAAAYLTCCELGVPRWLAFAVGASVTLDPAVVLYGNWLSWTFPAAALVSVGLYLGTRYVRTASVVAGLGCATCWAAVVLSDAIYQAVWLVVVLGVLLAFRRPSRRALLAIALPLLVVIGWCVRGAILFGTPTTSSWLGMNLNATTVALGPTSTVHRLVDQGRLSRLTEVAPFSAVSSYEPRFVHVEPTGIPALDERTKSDGTPNYNNLVYLEVSRRYLNDDLAYITNDPLHYLGNVSVAARLWFLPSDAYPFLDPNRARIAGYVDAFDVAALWQPSERLGTVGGFAAALGHPPPPRAWSWFTVAEFALVLLGTPVVVVTRRRDRKMAASLVAAWLTIVYVYAVTSSVSLLDNVRFRFELGAIPLVTATVVATVAARALVGIPTRGAAEFTPEATEAAMVPAARRS